ncbi:MAG: DinB family protein [Proteobacteria bacterium]|nr:DinB family protein [Burkholderiales bacterium]
MLNAAAARRYVRYNAWADKVMFDAVAALPDGEASKSRSSLFKNIVHTLNHNYVIDQIWRGHLEGKPHGYTARNTPEHPPLAELWTRQHEAHRWYLQWADAMTDPSLGEWVEYELIGGNKGRMTRGDILMHVVTHHSYHRGFAADLFYQVPAKPPSMDLPVYYREAPAEYRERVAATA